MARENPVEFSVNSNDVMQIMLYLLRKLMDIQNNVIIKNTLNYFESIVLNTSVKIVHVTVFKI